LLVRHQFQSLLIVAELLVIQLIKCQSNYTFAAHP